MFENEQESEDAIEGLNKAGLQASFARVGQVVKFCVCLCVCGKLYVN